MSTFSVDWHSVRVPSWVTDFTSFRRWVYADEFPEVGRIRFLQGEVWVDMSKEQFIHNQIKGEYASVLMQFVKRQRNGRYFPDGYLLSNTNAELSTNPDGMFAATETLRTGRAQLIQGTEIGLVELEGTPDMVLEVVR